MSGEYNFTLVALSYLVSVLGAYTALQMAVAIPRSKNRFHAILASATVMGGGAIWAMHFIAMLAFEMAIPVEYDTLLTILSALLAILSCAAGLAIAGSGVFSVEKLVPAGLFMGCGVASMHYTGMAAMLMPATVSYDVLLLTASIVIAVAASSAALWMAFHMRGVWQILGGAMVAGVAVCGMHYTGMAAANYSPTDSVQQAGPLGSLGGEYLGISIAGISVVLLLVSLLITYSRQRKRESISI